MSHPMTRVLGIVFLGLLLGGTPAWVCALDLRVEQDAWSHGMGNATAAIGGGTHSFFINPAGTDRVSVPMLQLGGAYRSGDPLRGGHLVVLVPTGEGTVFGLGLVQDTHPGLVNHQFIQGSAAHPLLSSHRLTGGVALKVLRSRLEEPRSRSAHGFSMDLGLLYDQPLRSGDTLSFGLVVRDASGSIRSNDHQEESVTRTFTLAAAYQRNPLMRFETDLELVDRGSAPTEMKSRLKVGAERFFRRRHLSARVGIDDLLDSAGSFTLGGGYHPDRPYEAQVGLGFSGKDQGVHASLSLVYRWDAWKGMEWTGDRSARIDLGPEGDVQEVAPLEGRPVSPVPLRRMRFSVTPATLSPDQDGLNDAATLRVEGLPEDLYARWEIALNHAGETGPFRLFSGVGHPPSTLVWDGTDGEGHTAPDGRYDVILRVFNRDSYIAVQDSRRILVSTGVAHLRLSAVTKSFSPGNLKAKNRVTLRVSTDAGPRITRWEISVSPVGSMEPVVVARGPGRPPRQWVWKGLDGSSAVVPDGAYEAVMTAQLQGGGSLTSDSARMSVDTRPPTVSLETKQPLVDFNQGPATLRLLAEDEQGVASWRLVVMDEAGVELRSEQGEGTPPSRWVWDGSGNPGAASAQPGGFYTVRLEAFDAAGNRSTTDALSLQAKTASMSRTEQLMSLNLVTVYFLEGSANLTEEGVQNLRGAIESIRPYLDKSTLVVKGCTDGAETGDALKLSYERAKVVRDFLAESLQVDRAHIQALGLGDTEPLMISGGAAPAERQRRAVVSLTTQP